MKNNTDTYQDYLPWFTLKSVHGIGNYLFRKLIERFHHPKSVFEASQKELIQIKGISEELANRILEIKISDAVKQDLELVANHHYHIVTMTDPMYPPLLRQIHDPPPFLYVYGNLSPLSQKISVVGTRGPTSYGLNVSKSLVADLVKYPFVIVSGMARGIDSSAHRAAISAHGETIAVLGCGLNCIYPQENESLYHQIAEHGAVISEFPVLAPPEPYHFPLRNRIVSGLSYGTIVVEAAQKSGALITAMLALEQGREVFAVPGNIFSPKSKGTHMLIKQGAKLVEKSQDVIDELNHLLSNSESLPVTKESVRLSDAQLSQFSDVELQVIKAMEPYPLHIDDIYRKVQIASGTLAGILLKLELQGLIVQTPGKMFNIKEAVSCQNLWLS
ncbi:MAG: DNA-protecting protein DprA [Desulfobacterales bacterium]|nr:DNA-protecting protein DprA [Desulfobacterales bacterium]